MKVKKLVDLEFLLNSYRNDTEKVKEFVKDVLELNAISVSSMNKAFMRADYAEVKITAHMLKSSADIFDSIQYKNKLVELENKCKVEEKEGIEKTLKELNIITADWEKELYKELQKLV